MHRLKQQEQGKQAGALPLLQMKSDSLQIVHVRQQTIFRKSVEKLLRQ